MKTKMSVFPRIILALVDVAIVFLAAIAAFWMTTWARSETLLCPNMLWIWIAFNVALTLGLYVACGMYNMVFSSVGMLEVMRIALVSLGIGACNLLFALCFGRAHSIGFSAVLIYTVFTLFASLFLRFSKRTLILLRRAYAQHKNKNRIRVMIVGGGDAGTTLIKEMIAHENSKYAPVCILDDDVNLQGKKIYDVRVVGTTQEVKSAVRKYAVQEIFIAMPSASKKIQSAIIQRCDDCGCTVKVLPGLYQLVDGQVAVSKLREVDIQDLLGREQVQVDLDEVMRYIKDKTVMVTGGGGSIGSELCRQIASHAPRLLIILDIYENNAYDIEQELKRSYPQLPLLTLIASIRDKGKIRDVFAKYRPQIVFNAAAHKHVPLMENSPNEAVKNNVFGTLNVARAADEFGVETFVQISTDKAVNPTNIMGATKRICEMIIQTIGKNSKNTKFVAVRFGNVLGSNGSVIPLFKKQIADGGPVTVTHKDIIRYFMTIPEAVALVLQAGAYAQGGQIFVLDMGEPVRIYDLAYNLIKLSGLEPGVDIEIQCTGLRPGEKLFEERLMQEEGLQKTANGLINIAKPIPLDEDNLWNTLDKLYEAAYSETDVMKQWVKELVPTYTID